MTRVPNFHIGADVLPGLYKLAEECTELGAVLVQLATFPFQPRPEGREQLERRLEEELGDLLGAVRYFRAHNTATRLDWDAVEARADAKFALFQRWDAEARR